MKMSGFILALLLLSTAVDGGTTGKITGQVTDRSGEPLPGANVWLLGTKLGATTDEEGFYLILSVTPGLYTVSASMIAFETATREEIVVTSDRTTNVSFTLREKTFEADEVVVTATRGEGGWGMLATRGNAPAVEPDRTSSRYLVSAADIEAVSNVRTTAEFVELMPGVSSDAFGEVTIRASGGSDLAYYVDGVVVPNHDQAEARVFRDYNRLAVQEMTVITGGLDAEYGNAQGGVVSIVSREGGPTYRGLADYRLTPAGKKHWGPNVYDSAIHQGRNRWDDPDWVAETVTLPDGRVVLAHQRRDYTGAIGHDAQMSLSGPLTKGLTFFASGHWAREAVVFPGPENTTPPRVNLTGKVAGEPTDRTRLTLGGWLSRTGTVLGRIPAVVDNGQFSLDVPGDFRILRDGGRSIFLDDPSSGEGRDTDHMVSASFTHALNNRTFYEARLTYSGSHRDTSGVFSDPDTHLSQWSTSEPILDEAGEYQVHRDVLDWSRWQRRRLMLKADITTQVDRRHLVKAGIEAIRYDNWHQSIASSGPDLTVVSWYGRSYSDTDLFPGRENVGVNPIQLALYIQDKIELSGMIVNAGLRADLFYPRSTVTDMIAFGGRESPMWNRMTRNRRMPTVASQPIHALSPRLGVSHPVTDRSVIRFHYGRFVQFPTFREQYVNQYGREQLGDADLNGNGVLDSGEFWNAYEATQNQHREDLSFEQTTSFELGVDWNLVTNYVVSATTYYRSAGRQVRDGFGSWSDLNRTLGDFNVRQFTQLGFKDTRGFEGSIKRRFSDMFAFNVAINLQWAENGFAGGANQRTFPDSLFVANGHYWVTYDVDPTTGAEIPVPLREQALREGKTLPDGSPDPDFYIRQFGSAANRAIRQAHVEVVEDPRTVWDAENGHFAAEGVSLTPGEMDQSFYRESDRSFWHDLNGRPDYPGTGEGNLMLGQRLGGSSRTSSTLSDRRSFGSLTLVFATPGDFGPLDGLIIGDLRANLVYRYFTGTALRVLRENRHVPGPMHTRTDLNVEKSLKLGDRRLTFGMEIYNLFNQKDLDTVNDNLVNDGTNTWRPTRDIDFDVDRWQQWGITGLDPVTALNLGTDELYDVNNAVDAPRQIRVSARFTW